VQDVAPGELAFSRVSAVAVDHDGNGNAFSDGESDGDGDGDGDRDGESNGESNAFGDGVTLSAGAGPAWNTSAGGL
jgi:hypothetical protein